MRGSTCKRLRHEWNILTISTGKKFNKSFKRYKKEYQHAKNLGVPWKLVALKALHTEVVQVGELRE